MSRLRAALVVASASLLTGGCVAAAIPVIAGGTIARDKLRSRDPQRPPQTPQQTPTPAAAIDMPDRPGTSPVPSAATTPPEGTVAPDAAAVPEPEPEVAPPALAAATTSEDAARSLQAYQALWTYLSAQVAARKRGEPVRSVVLEAGATLDAPRYASCQGKPLAILFDIDEDAGKSLDPGAMARPWVGDGSDRLVAVPGAVEGIDAARREGVTVIFSTARSPYNAPGVANALDRLGFGRVEEDKTLYLRGESAADGVRRTIASHYCVIALVGDSINDFSDLFAATGTQRQLAAVTDTMVTPLFGAGWFLLPNPIRATAPASPSTGVK